MNFQFLRRLVGFEEPDELMAVLKRVQYFTRLSWFDRITYPRSYQGMKRIGLFKAHVRDSQHGLYAILRVYRTKETPYRYLLVWTFGDDQLPDGVLDVMYRTPVAFAASDLEHQIDLIVASMNTMVSLHSLYRMTSPSSQPCTGSVGVQQTQDDGKIC